MFHGQLQDELLHHDRRQCSKSDSQDSKNLILNLS